jgi:hypothetical protein
MLGMNSFEVVDNGDSLTAFYQGSVMSQWKSMIGFSGTLAPSTLAQIKVELDQPICISIPLLRKDGVENRLVDVVGVLKSQKIISIVEAISERKYSCTNFVIILNDCEEARNLMAYTEFIEIAKPKKVIAFLDFS